MKTQVEQPLSKELTKLNYKVSKLERDTYEEDKVPETDEEEEKSLTVAWKDFCDAVAQGTTPEIIAESKEKERLEQLFNVPSG